MTPPAVQDLGGFTTLGSNSSHYRPKDQTAVNTTTDEIKLIILCPWMGAQPKHIVKYTQTYQQLLPRAELLVIQSGIVDITWRSFSQQRQNLAKAVKLIHNYINHSREIQESKQALPIVLHVFSHGGSNSAIQLLKAVEESTSSTETLPLSAFILDSTPGSDDYWRSYNAAITAFPKTGPMYLVGAALVHFTTCIFAASSYFGGSFNIETIRRALLDDTIFAKGTKRTYLYSKADRMVDWQLVRKHAEEAQAKGHTVEQHCFESSPHCAHIQEDHQVYWKAVTDTWKA